QFVLPEQFLRLFKPDRFNGRLRASNAEEWFCCFERYCSAAELAFNDPKRDSNEAYERLIHLRMKEGRATQYNNIFQRSAARIDNFDTQAVRQWRFGAYPKIQEFVAHLGLEPDDLSGHMALAEEIGRSAGRNRYHKNNTRPHYNVPQHRNQFKQHDSSSAHDSSYDMDFDMIQQTPATRKDVLPKTASREKGGPSEGTGQHQRDINREPNEDQNATSLDNRSSEKNDSAINKRPGNDPQTSRPY
ncbi:hypothetical protein BGW41_007664, partial [Actinomortierella wolfii]